ncbi:hypothetical protein QEH59_05060 [Coraliomargarita sp. SDUM461004]|uniref:Uncharacterized protein n=1 Tax=Thalassobacterium sedimentorum TaxID=3041258 RepID=A0ABU1AIT2_9BACT|nr:hypothetical protein [Coraliomargarita sp. SDUM461004]MDQ8193780.1 hypothetical protein [Coraliomargarita sp. SDUM461004]
MTYRSILFFLLFIATQSGLMAENFSIRTFGRNLSSDATFWISSNGERKAIQVSEHSFSDYQNYVGSANLALYRDRESETPITTIQLPVDHKKLLLIFLIDENNRTKVIPIREVPLFNEAGWLYLINATNQPLVASVNEERALLEAWNSNHLRFPDVKRIRVLLGANDGQEWKIAIRSNIRLGSAAARKQQNVFVFIVPQRSSEERQAAKGALTWFTFRETIAPPEPIAENNQE